MDYLIPTYNRLPVAFTSGKGAWLSDKHGNKFLDALSGISVTNLGHSHPALIETLTQQANQVWHTSNMYQISAQETLSQKLCEISKMHSAFICNSGSEANEIAIKLTRLYGKRKGINSPKVIVFEGGFHGRTMAAISATDNPAIREDFKPLVEGFVRLAFNDSKALSQLAAENEDIVAVMFEPVQGEGGIQVATDDFMQHIANLAKKQDWLILCDEIQSGMLRSGEWYAHHHVSLPCDILTTAKALGNGFPIGACLVNHKAIGLFQVGSHGSTFGGNPLASKVATQVIEIMQTENYATRVQQLTQYFATGLHQKFEHLKGLLEVRQKGLLIGIELDKKQFDCQQIVLSALNHKLLINLTATNVVRLLPPFVLTHGEVDQIIERLSLAIQDCAIH